CAREGESNWNFDFW
nr:immunoglobulin heavy chain junction region [Macaca mulatta]MOW77618.1 immunoglobulin heavy chain junction region [Macaca mulatta]MOW81465.1 immunoglobulin heavy chain junction region [Macaca mulatta]MOW82097.1 immunoglobulin heavy chain junction region [Macaca mulatta]MOW85195.1 immunoglobulin heavy chain junction region [Macaca mulatta]